MSLTIEEREKFLAALTHSQRRNKRPVFTRPLQTVEGRGWRK